MTKKIALITGATGQDGAYLSEFLVKKGYEVHGIKRRSSSFNTGRIDHLYQDPHVDSRNFILHHGDLTDATNLIRVVQEVQPDEIYNLAAQSHVAVSFETPEYTANSDALGVLRILEAIRILGLAEKTRFYQASTSEMFGKVQEAPQSETTPFYPRSPYGAAKVYAYWICVNYREAYNMFCCNGILFNHESPIRGETFVTRKITRATARISLGLQEKFYLGNMDSLRDWGHVQLEWRGEGVEEEGLDVKTGAVRVGIDPRYFRPTEVEALLGDPSKAEEKLGWTARTSLSVMVKEMVADDLNGAEKDEMLRREGFQTFDYYE